MRITLVTPLWPPDIANPAPYAKELATRLATEHSVHVIAYNHLPEPVPGVTITTIEKQQPLPTRLWQCLKALLRATKDSDVIVVNNGVSTELPALLISLITRTPILIYFCDPKAVAAANNKLLFGFITRLARSFVQATIAPPDIPADHALALPAARPAIHPFLPHPTEAFAAYERSWEQHLTALSTILNTYDTK